MLENIKIPNVNPSVNEICILKCAYLMNSFCYCSSIKQSFNYGINSWEYYDYIIKINELKCIKKLYIQQRILNLWNKKLYWCKMVTLVSCLHIQLK